MVTNPLFDLLPSDLCGDDGQCVPAGAAQAEPAAAEQAVPEELDGERDLGSLDLPDDDYTGDWREEFGDSVGISSWREL